MKEDKGRMVTIQIEYLKDLNLLSIEKTRKASYYLNRGFNPHVAAQRANAEVSTIQNTHSFTVMEYKESLPWSDLVSDIAGGRTHEFSVEYI